MSFSSIRQSRLLHPLGVASSRWERLAIAVSAGAMGTLGFSLTAPLLPDLADALNVDRASIGLVQAAVSVPGVLLSALIGYLADRWGRRRVILTALLLFTTFGTMGFFARSFWPLIGTRLIQGIGTSGILGLSIVVVGDLFEGRDRTRAMGYNLAGLTGVNMVGPTVSGLVATSGVFRPFLLFLIGIPLAFWATRLPQEPRRETETPFRHAGAAIREIRHRGQLVDFSGVLVATLATTMLLHGFGFTTAPLYLDSVFGIGSGGRGVIIAAFQTGSVIAAVQIGRLRGKLSGSRLVGIALSSMALGAAVTAVAPEWWFVPIGLGLTGIGFGLFVPLAQEQATSVGGAAFRGLTVLTWVTVVRMAQVIGPPLGSSLSEGIGPRPTFGLAAAGMTLAFVSWRPLRAWMKAR